MQTRNSELMMRQLMRVQRVQRACDITQRVQDQAVDAPGDRHREDQRQQQEGGQQGRNRIDDKAVHPPGVGLQHQIGERLRVGGPLQRIERQGDLHRQLKDAGERHRNRALRRKAHAQRLELIRQHDIRTANHAGGFNFAKDRLRLRNIGFQNGRRERLAHRAGDALHLHGGVVAMRLHEMKQQNDAENKKKKDGNGRNHRHLFYREGTTDSQLDSPLMPLPA